MRGLSATAKLLVNDIVLYFFANCVKNQLNAVPD